TPDCQLTATKYARHIRDPLQETRQKLQKRKIVDKPRCVDDVPESDEASLPPSLRMIIENAMKRKLEAGGLAASLNLIQWRTVNAGSRAVECGFDWLFIDMEHNSMDLDTVAQICVAALPTGITPIVRVPSHDS